MASKALKGLTIKIGGDTSELTKALDGVEKQSRDLSSELGQINKLLKLDPKNTELLAQKQKVLADAIGSTEKKLETLREAEKQVQEQFERGEVSEAQYRALQREIIATEKKLDGYKNAAKETADAVEELGKESDGAAKDVKDAGKNADDAQGAFEGLGEKAATAAKVGLAALAAAAVGVVAGIKNVVEETAEYRNAMSKLDTAFQDNDHSAKAAYDTYADLQSILGDTDQAVEAANHLAKLCDTEEELAEWTEIATGVYATFGDSLPIEGLTEAANETAKTGQLTGALADALNWAGISEDDFQESLDKCTTEQERQKKITDALTKAYGKAADKFKETNKEVIAQNKATEKLNKAWAKIGNKAAPIVTTFTEGMAELVEAFVELLEDVDIEPFLKIIRDGFQTLTKQVLPKLIDALEWVADNFDIIKSAALGFIAALAVSKIASFASMVTGTLVSALQAGTVKQLAMNAAANANPYVLLASALVAVGTALVSYYNANLEKATDAAYEATKAAYGLTEAEIEMTERANEAADAFRNQRDAMNDSISGIQSQFSYIGTLKGEMLNLVDAQGRVAEKDQARVKFILGELNAALGTEYELVDGQIQKYSELAGSIDEVILKKKTELLLSAGGDAYAAAIRGKQQVEEDYYKSILTYQELRLKAQELDREGLQLTKEKEEAVFIWEHNALNERIAAHNGEVEAIRESFTKAQEAYENNREALEGYYNDIGQYETAQRLALEGNTEEAARIMSDRAYYQEKYADKVGFESDQIMNIWELEAITAGIEAGNLKKNWEKGTEGYTGAMVAEAESGYNDAMKAMSNAYDDAYGVGEDLGEGMTAGVENKRSSLLAKARSLVASFFATIRDESDTHSPSRKAIKVFEDVGEGAVVGIDNKTDDLEQSAQDQVAAVLGAYKGLNAPDAQKSLEGLADIEFSNQNRKQTNLATANTAVLDKILAAIEKGQVLLLDGDAVVGGTVDRYNQKLGMMQVLAARGAK